MLARLISFILLMASSKPAIRLPTRVRNRRDFFQGLMLQVLNPKLIVYAFTIFSAFLAPVTNDAALVMLAAFLLAAISFGSTSVWAIFGTAIKPYLHNPRLKMIVNILLSLSLAYTAIALTGLV